MCTSHENTMDLEKRRIRNNNNLTSSTTIASWEFISRDSEDSPSISSSSVSGITKPPMFIPPSVASSKGTSPKDNYIHETERLTMEDSQQSQPEKEKIRDGHNHPAELKKGGKRKPVDLKVIQEMHGFKPASPKTNKTKVTNKDKSRVEKKCMQRKADASCSSTSEPLPFPQPASILGEPLRVPSPTTPTFKDKLSDFFQQFTKSSPNGCLGSPEKSTFVSSKAITNVLSKTSYALSLESDEGNQQQDHKEFDLPPFSRNSSKVRRFQKTAAQHRMCRKLLSQPVTLLDGFNVEWVSSEGKPVLLSANVIADVFLARLVNSGHLVAVKMYHFRYVTISNILHEAAIWSYVSERTFGVCANFHGLVLFGGHPEKHQTIALIYDYIGDIHTPKFVNLEDLMDDEKERRRRYMHPIVTTLEWMEIAMDVLSKMESVHKLNILLTDLCSTNILFRAQHGTWTPFLINFCYASYHSTKNFLMNRPNKTAIELTGRFHKLPHIAPERITDSRWCPASDIYSLGMVLMDMSCYTNVPLRQIAAVCLHGNYKKRPTMKKLKVLMQKYIDQYISDQGVIELTMEDWDLRVQNLRQGHTPQNSERGEDETQTSTDN